MAAEIVIAMSPIIKIGGQFSVPCFPVSDPKRLVALNVRARSSVHGRWLLASRNAVAQAVADEAAAQCHPLSI